MGYFISDEQMGYLKSFIKDLSEEAYIILLRVEDRQSNNILDELLKKEQRIRDLEAEITRIKGVYD
jgi:hypothetical protein